MSCRNNQRLTSTRINMERSGSSEDNPVMRKTDKQEPENPITIVMSLEILFNEEEQPGPAFPFVKALSAVNDVLRNCDPESKELFKVLFIHDNKNLEQKINTNHNLLAELKDIITPLAVSEERLIDELQKNKTDLYLSASPQSSQEVMKQGIAAAVMLTPEKTMDVKGTPLRLVFDGDAVIFSNESECIFAKGGLKEYMDNEAEKVDHPLSEGPFKNFLEALGKLQKKFKERDCPIRTYLVTSRDAGNAGYRAMNTLKLWGLEIDEAYFLKGSPKGPVLKVIAPHIFFDDIEDHAKGALKEGVVACHVQY